MKAYVPGGLFTITILVTHNLHNLILLHDDWLLFFSGEEQMFQTTHSAEICQSKSMTKHQEWGNRLLAEWASVTAKWVLVSQSFPVLSQGQLPLHSSSRWLPRLLLRAMSFEEYISRNPPRCSPEGSLTLRSQAYPKRLSIKNLRKPNLHSYADIKD